MIKGSHHSPATIGKMSIAHKGKPLSEAHCRSIMLGTKGKSHKWYPRSKETGDKISAANMGHLTSQATRDKISMANIEIPRPKAAVQARKNALALKGRTLSIEHKLMLSKIRSEGICSGRIKPVTWGKCGYIFSIKMNQQFFVQSSYEGKAIRMFDADSTIVSFTKNPYRIPYWYGGKNRFYIPDFETIDAQGNKSLIEVTASFRLADLQRQARHEVGRKFAEENGMSFVILTEDDLLRIDETSLIKKGVCFQNEIQAGG